MESLPAEPQKRRMSKKEFLCKTMEVLTVGGNAEVWVDELSSRPGVTTGCFCWHFKGREGVVSGLVVTP